MNEIIAKTGTRKNADKLFEIPKVEINLIP